MNLGPAATIAWKDLRILTREPWSLFWVLGFPLVLALLFGFLYEGLAGGPRAHALPIAVVDEDGTEASARFAARLERAPELQVERAASAAEARERVRRGRLAAFVVLKKGFGGAAGPFGGGAPALAVGVDPARGTEGGFLQGVLVREAAGAARERFADPAALRESVRLARAGLAMDPGADAEDRERLDRFLAAFERFLGEVRPGAWRALPAWEPAAIEALPLSPSGPAKPRSPFEVSFPQAVLWAIMGCVSYFAVSLAAERTQGTLLRLRFSPLSGTQILLGKNLGCLALCAAVQFLALGFGRIAFGVRVGNLPALLLAVPAVSAGFTGMMVLIAALGRSEQVTGAIASSVFVLSAMIGGGTIPLLFMPPWMQAVSHASPVKWGILALEGAVWRELGPGEMALPCGLLVGFGAVCFAAGQRLFRRRDGA
jgi:ABC-2 type transport system permease protein